MKTSRPAVFTALCALALAGAGCNPFARPVAAPQDQVMATSTEPELTALPPAKPDTSCSNAYAPFPAGSAITYHTTYGQKLGDATVSVTTNDSHVADLSLALTGAVTTTVAQRFTCDNGAVKAKEYQDMGNTLSGQPIKLTTESVTGDYLPADLSDGVSWTTTYVVGIASEDPTLKEQLKGLREHVEVQNTVLAHERLTVAAGIFDTVKVLTQVNVKQEGVAGGPSFGIPMTHWYAKGLGLVKATAGGSGTPWTLEATGMSP